MKTMDADYKKMVPLIHKFKKKRVLVLGDIMLDKYIWGDVSRISPEAPVPVVEVKADSSSLGGAGNVAQNLSGLGVEPLLVGVVGDDEPGRWIRQSIQESSGVFIDKSRPTTVKTRIIAHHQQVVRVDRETKTAIAPAIREKILAFIFSAEYDGLLISDYHKGMIHRPFIGLILSFAKERGIPVFVDPKMENFLFYSPVTLVTPNHHEAEKIVRHPCRTEAEVEKAGFEIMSLISSRYLIIKRGEHGMTVFEKGKKPRHIPTVAREVFDVTGAGDTVIAAATAALLAGATIQEAALISNAAAGIVVAKIGTATVTPLELLAALTGGKRKKTSR